MATAVSMSSTANKTWRRPRGFAGAGPSPPWADGGGKFTRSSRPSAVRGPHHAVHPTALDLPLALQLESELEEESRRGREVVDHDADVLHALDRHAPLL